MRFMGDREITNIDFLSRITSDQLIDVGRLNPIDLATAVQTIANEISPYHLWTVFAIITTALVTLFLQRHELPFIF